MNDIKFTIGAIIVGVILCVGSCVGYTKLTKIRPGYVGVSIRKCGSGGVSADPIPTGYYWRELFCEEVVEYPISMQSLILTKNPHEGTGGPDKNEEDQSIAITSSEGLRIDTDVALNFTLDSAQVPHIYEKWREDIENISHKYIRQTIREGLQNVFAQYSAEELYGVKKESARAQVEQFLRTKLAPMGFNIQQFAITRIEPPDQVIKAINAKVAMVQQAQQSEQEIKKKEAEASQAVAVAKGKAESMKTEAEGEAQAIAIKAAAQAQANKVLSESITPELVEYEKATRWNGALPGVTGGVIPMMSVK